MPAALKRVLWIGGGLLALAIVYLIYQRASANNLERLLAGDDPFGVRIALLDERNQERLEVLAQAVVFPGRQRILLYFVNTDASFSEEGDALVEMSPGAADRFDDFTGVSSEYYLHVSRENFVRLLNLADGVTVFLEEPHVFEEQLFQYPQGSIFLHGEHFAELALARKPPPQPDRAYMTGVERLYRIESSVLNLFWNLPQFEERLASEEMRAAAAGLFETNLNEDELGSLYDFLRTEGLHLSVKETPLALSENRRAQKLLVKEQRARILYEEFVEDLKAGRLTAENIPVEVLNGTEIAGAARRLKQFLQDRGLPVLHADNYPYKPLGSSRIVERSGNSFSARKLLEITGLERDRVSFRRMPVDVGVSFLIGTDFDARKLQLR